MAEQGKVRPLAIYSDKRNPYLPNVPTMKELGWDVVVHSVFGIAGPKGMDPKVVQTLQESIRKAMDDPDFKKTLQLSSQPTTYNGQRGVHPLRRRPVRGREANRSGTQGGRRQPVPVGLEDRVTDGRRPPGTPSSRRMDISITPETTNESLALDPEGGVRRLIAAIALAACGGSDDLPSSQITTLGTRADLVTDGDARVQVQLPAGANAATAKVLANGSDVTSSFTNSNGTLVGLVTGLAVGRQHAGGNGRRREDHAARDQKHVARRPGPVRATANAVLLRDGRGPAGVGQCSGNPRQRPLDRSGRPAMQHRDRIQVLLTRRRLRDARWPTLIPVRRGPPPQNACFKPYTPGMAAPADLATTTTDGGQTVPYIVRVERGTMNRGIYDLAVLVDPTKPVALQPTWNGKVQFVFGGGGSQPRRQMRPATAWTDDDALSRGWIVTNNSMTDASINNNRVVSAETVMMMKEHIVDRYGPVRFAVGKGNSGGSITAYVVSSFYPGLLDGALIYQSLLDYDTSHTLTWECSSWSRCSTRPRGRTR
jgi:hypothetical protein